MLGVFLFSKGGGCNTSIVSRLEPQHTASKKESGGTFVDMLSWEPFTPLVERVAVEAPELAAGLHRLQENMLPAEFEKYINSLLNLKQGNGMLLLITKKEMYRSIIESKFLSVIRSSFGVDKVRIISQP